MNLRTRKMVVGLIGFFFFLLLSIICTAKMKDYQFYWTFKGFFLLLDIYFAILIFKSIKEED